MEREKVSALVSSRITRELLSFAPWNLFQRIGGVRIVRNLRHDPVQVYLEETESQKVSDMQLERAQLEALTP